MGRHLAALFTISLALTLLALGVTALRAAPDTQADSALCDRPTGDFAAIIAACTRLVDAKAASDRLPDVLLNRGNAHFRMGNVASAIADFNEAINRRPAFVVAYKNRGIARMSSGDLSGSLEDFNQAIRLAPKDADLYTLRGALLNATGEYNRAATDLSQAIDLDPGSDRARVNRAFAFLHLRLKDKALADYDAALRIAPQKAAIHVGRATVLMDQGDLAGAEASLTEAIRLAPSDALAYSVRGEVRRLAGDLPRALGDHDTAVRLAPDSADVYVNRALVLRDRHDYERAQRDLDEALLRNPRHALAFADRGEIAMLRGNLDQALADLDKALGLDPRSPVALTLLGDALRLKGDTARALDAYDRATNLVSDYDAAITGRGLALEQAGKLEEARDAFATAVRLPADQDAEKARPAQAAARQHLAAVAAEIERRQRAAREASAAPDPAALASARTVAAAAETRLQEAEARAREADRKVREAEDQAKVAAAGALRLEAQARAREAAAEARAAEAEARLRDAERSAKQLALDAAARTAAIPDQGRRVALVIGNSAYRSVPYLDNPRRDADAVAAALRGIGFDKVVLVEDATLMQMKKALRDFQDLADDADWAMVYYAGHGIEIAGENYLIPVDAHLQSDRDAEDEAVSLRYLLDKLHNARKLHLVVLDACRENPFQGLMRRQLASRAVVRGLAPFEPRIANEMVVYAAKGGEQARDGDAAGHSPFAKAFVDRLATPRVEINKLFRLVTADVLQATENKQQPFVYGSTPGEEDFYFRTR